MAPIGATRGSASSSRRIAQSVPTRICWGPSVERTHGSLPPQQLRVRCRCAHRASASVKHRSRASSSGSEGFARVTRSTVRRCAPKETCRRDQRRSGLPVPRCPWAHAGGGVPFAAGVSRPRARHSRAPAPPTRCCDAARDVNERGDHRGEGTIRCRGGAGRFLVPRARGFGVRPRDESSGSADTLSASSSVAERVHPELPRRHEIASVRRSGAGVP